MVSNFGGKQDFTRIHIGIGRPTSHDPAHVSQYVLSQFSKEELELLQKEVFDKII